MGDIVSLQAQMSPSFQLREKFKCIEHTDKSKTQLITLPETRKSGQNVSQFQIEQYQQAIPMMDHNICFLWKNMDNFPKIILVIPSYMELRIL